MSNRDGLLRAVVGIHERTEANPTAEIAARLAVALDASLDRIFTKSRRGARD